MCNRLIVVICPLEKDQVTRPCVCTADRRTLVIYPLRRCPRQVIYPALGKDPADKTAAVKGRGWIGTAVDIGKPEIFLALGQEPGDYGIVIGFARRAARPKWVREVRAVRVNTAVFLSGLDCGHHKLRPVLLVFRETEAVHDLIRAFVPDADRGSAFCVNISKDSKGLPDQFQDTVRFHTHDILLIPDCINGYQPNDVCRIPFNGRYRPAGS